jgi:hypothetical protein
MQLNRVFRMMLPITEQCVGPDLAVPSRSLGEGWCPGHGSLERRSADKPLDTLGALSLSKRRRPYMIRLVPADCYSDDRSHLSIDGPLIAIWSEAAPRP